MEESFNFLIELVKVKNENMRKDKKIIILNYKKELFIIIIIIIYFYLYPKMHLFIFIMIFNHLSAIKFKVFIII